MNIRPGEQPAEPDVHPATIHPDIIGDVFKDIAPETLTLLHIRQDEDYPAPADPDELESLKYFKQQTPDMKQRIVDELKSLGERAPDKELRDSLINLASLLALSIIKDM